MEEILPGVYIDGAHNENAVERFVETVKRRPVHGGRTVILFSAVKEKEYEKMIAELCQNLSVDSYVITTVESTRKVDAGELARIVRKYTDSEVTVREQLEEAWAEMMKQKWRRRYCLLPGLTLPCRYDQRACEGRTRMLDYEEELKKFET